MIASTTSDRRNCWYGSNIDYVSQCKSSSSSSRPPKHATTTNLRQPQLPTNNAFDLQINLIISTSHVSPASITRCLFQYPQPPPSPTPHLSPQPTPPSSKPCSGSPAPLSSPSPSTGWMSASKNTPLLTSPLAMPQTTSCTRPPLPSRNYGKSTPTCRRAKDPNEM